MSTLHTLAIIHRKEDVTVDRALRMVTARAEKNGIRWRMMSLDRSAGKEGGVRTLTQWNVPQVEKLDRSITRDTLTKPQIGERPMADQRLAAVTVAHGVLQPQGVTPVVSRSSCG